MKKEIMELAEKFQKMSLEDLRTINHVLIETIKVKRNTQNSLERMKFHIKQKVQQNKQSRNKAPYDTIGSIDKINPKYIVVNFKEQGHWNMLPSTLVAAE